MRMIVQSLKTSDSGKSDILSLRANISKKTALGTVTAIRFFNLRLEIGSCKLVEGEEIDLDMSDYQQEESVFTKEDGTKTSSFWLIPAL